MSCARGASSKIMMVGPSRGMPVSFARIAAVLNRKPSVQVPPPAQRWTAKLVRKAYTS
jgi:hypothetical protein